MIVKKSPGYLNSSVSCIDSDHDDDDDVIPTVSHSYISISSDEDERNSLTTSSVNLDASDHGDLSFEING